MKILVIRLSSIGDIVLTSPVLRCIKRQLPGAELHFVTKKRFVAVTASSPYIDKFIYYEDDLHAVIGELKNEGYDFVLDLHDNFRSRAICRKLKVRYSRVEKLNLEKFMLAKMKIDVMPDAHFVKRCFDAASLLGVKDDGLGLDFFISESDRVRESDLPLSHQAGYIALVIGATYNTKKLPDDKLIDLVKTIRHPVVLLGGPDDAASGEKVSAADPVKVYNACGKFSLGESADLVRKSRMVITHDTGLMHIAAAFQKDIISVWGNTDPRFGMYPYYGNSTSARSVLFERKPWCRPCSKLGYKKCPLFHFSCMKKQDTEEIARVAHQLLGIIH